MMTSSRDARGRALVAARAILCAIVALAAKPATGELAAQPTPARAPRRLRARGPLSRPSPWWQRRPRPTFEVAFSVRQALVGEGFELGVSGRLLVASSGVSFTANGDAAPSWTVGWRDLARARAAEGLWDSPSPLVIVERSERRHFIARIDRNGRHVSGEPLLLEIADGQRRFRNQGAPGPRIPAGLRIEKGEPNR